MRVPSALEVVRLWDWGRDKRSLDRALMALELALSDEGWDRERLLDLPVGRREALLLDLRALLIGPTLESHVTCPRCEETLEVTVDVDFVRVDTAATDPGRVFHHDAPSGRFALRLPTSRDVLALAHVAHPETSRRALLQRCLVGEARLEDLSEADVAALAARLASEDPQSDFDLQVECRACGHTWTVVIDAIEFLWTELGQHVQILADEVHRLASAYGWPEREILALSASRRQLYLERVP